MTFLNRVGGPFNSKIGIAAQFQFELKLVELKMELELNEYPGIEIENWNCFVFFSFFFATVTAALNQPSPNFSFDRGGHNLSCDWLLMQQECLTLRNQLSTMTKTKLFITE